MTESKLLGALLLKQARVQLAAKNIELRCRHEIITFDRNYGDRELGFEVDTVERYHQPPEQAELEKEMIRAEVVFFLENVVI